jgi:hypothetical protein
LASKSLEEFLGGRMMIRQFRKWICFGVVCLAVLMAVPVAAQLPAGTILGVVNDTSGASVPGPYSWMRVLKFTPSLCSSMHLPKRNVT